MNSVHKVISDALDEMGIQNRRRVANRVVKRLAEEKPSVAQWVADLGLLRFVGYVNRKTPSVIRDVPFVRDSTPVYMVNQESD